MICDRNMQARIMVFVHVTSSDNVFQTCEVLSKYLNQFLSYTASKICDRK